MPNLDFCKRNVQMDYWLITEWLKRIQQGEDMMPQDFGKAGNLETNGACNMGLVADGETDDLNSWSHESNLAEHLIKSLLKQNIDLP